MLCSGKVLDHILRNESCSAYDQAKEVQSKCSVIFFDEIDALGQSRGHSGNEDAPQSGGMDSCSRRILAELLIQLNRINSSKGNITANHAQIDNNYQDSVEEADDGDCILNEMSHSEDRIRVIVVAATNRPEDCDPALVRRFAIKILVGPPSKRDRKKILKRFLVDINHSLCEPQLESIAEVTEGWSGSDLESLTREAAMAPIRECIRRAALFKQRIRRHEQEVGDSSCQEDQANTDPHEVAREILLESFQKLRPVSVNDFRDEIAFWAANNLCDPCGVGGTNVPKRCIHYDSSSEEED